MEFNRSHSNNYFKVEIIVKRLYSLIKFDHFNENKYAKISFTIRIERCTDKN